MKTREQLMINEAERELLANKALQTAIVKYQSYYRSRNRGTIYRTEEYLQITSDRLIEKILALEEEIEGMLKDQEEIAAFIKSNKEKKNEKVS